MPHANTIAFASGQVAKITLVDHASLSLGVSMPRLARALRRFLREHFVPVWGTPADLEVTDDTEPGAWAMVFVDDQRGSQDLGIHELTDDGFPLSKVFVRNILEMGDSISATACHELCEMLVDPAFNLCAEGPRHRMYAYETADPCEDDLFDVDGVTMSDFVYPSWFEGFHRTGATKFDHLGFIDRPFRLRPTGYISVFEDGGWNTRTGSRAKARRLAREDRAGHRSTLRGGGAHLMKRSLPLDVRRELRQAMRRGGLVVGPTEVGLLDRRRTRRDAAPAARPADVVRPSGYGA